MYKFIAIITLFFFCFPLLAQSYTTKKTVKGKTKKIFTKGMQYTISGENQKALKEFEKALKDDPTFINAQIQWAAVHYDLKSFNQAEIGFEKVLAIDPTYNLKVLYTLALSEMKLKKFGEAKEHFDQFLQSKSKNETLIEKAKKHILICQFSDQAYSNPVPFQPKSLGKNINTNNSEYLPSLTADGNTLVYTVRKNGQEDFYISKKVDGLWQKGKPIEEINTLLNEGAQSISADGKFLVFTACDRKDGYGSCDLYFSEVINGRWTPSKNIGPPINTPARETQPSLSADGRAIYFASNRKGGNGAMDVWVSYRHENGSWGDPQNLGDSINTKMEDRSPFIHPDGQSLYFNSNGHPGMGGSDLFLARKKENGTWEKPKNLGFPINTKSNEATLVVSLDGKIAYFATDRIIREGEKFDPNLKDKGEQLDIFSFELYPDVRPKIVTYVKAHVYDSKTKKSLSAKIEFIDLSRSKSFASSLTDSEGEFLTCLPIGKNYALKVSKENYLFHSENFSLDQTNVEGKPYLLEIALQAIPTKIITGITKPQVENPNGLPISEPIILKNVFFESGSADLKDESITELQNLKKMLENYPAMKIQLNGHTDNVGKEVDNLVLSQNRAKAVYDYLIQNDIESKRLTYKGFGETTPIDTNETEDGKQKNRRTEFVIIE